MSRGPAVLAAAQRATDRVVRAVRLSRRTRGAGQTWCPRL